MYMVAAYTSGVASTPIVTSPALSQKSSTTSRPVMPRVPPPMVPPVSFEPSRLPALRGSRRHCPRFHLQLASFASLTVFAGSSLRVIGRSNVIDTVVPAAEGVTPLRPCTARGFALSSSSISSHWVVPFYFSKFTLHKRLSTSNTHLAHPQLLIQVQLPTNSRRTCPVPTNCDNSR